MPSLTHDLIENNGLVFQQPLAGRFIQAEFQDDRRDAVEITVAGLPHFAETADAEQFNQFPIAHAGGTVAGLETRPARRQKNEQIFRSLQREGERHCQAGGIAGTT